MADTAGKQSTRDRPRSTPEVSAIGHQNGHRLEARTTAYLLWEDMSFPERLGFILDQGKTRDWLNDEYLTVLMQYRHDAIQWGTIMVEWIDRRQRPKDLEQAVAKQLRLRSNQAPATARAARPERETLTHLVADDIPPPLQLFEGLMHEGMLLFGGKSKRGKSWLMFDLALALALGNSGFRHFACRQQRPVLYLALEDGRARLQGRAKAIQPTLQHADHFHLYYNFPALTEGGLDILAEDIAREKYGLVVIDVLAKVEPHASGGEKNYHEIYDMFTPLQELRKHHPFCLAMLTHLRKQDADDIFDSLLGSVAYQGAQDVLWVLERKPKDDFAFLHIRDKDAEDKTIALRFNSGHWEYIGEGEEYEVSRDQRKVIQFLAQEKTECSLEEVRKGCSFTDAQYAYLRKLLSAMVKDDLVHRAKHGKYSATIRGELEMGTVSEDNDRVPF